MDTRRAEEGPSKHNPADSLACSGFKARFSVEQRLARFQDGDGVGEVTIVVRHNVTGLLTCVSVSDDLFRDGKSKFATFRYRYASRPLSLTSTVSHGLGTRDRGSLTKFFSKLHFKGILTQDIKATDSCVVLFF
jgi:hypothetical protein